MADKRMFSKEIMHGDVLLSIASPAAKLLYIYMGLAADDDGFVGAVSAQMLLSGSTPDDLDILINSGLVYRFESGVCVIIHWLTNNNRPRSDRYKGTVYKKEKARLKVVDELYYEIIEPSEETPETATVCQPSDNQVATVCQPSGNQVATTCQPTVDNIPPEVNRSEMNRSEVNKRESKGRKSEALSSAPAKFGSYENVILTDDEYKRLKGEFSNADEVIERLSVYQKTHGKRYKSHYAVCRSWAKEDLPKDSKNQRSYDLDEINDLMTG